MLPVAETDSLDNITVLYGSGYITKNDTIYKVVTDHLGSVRMIVYAETGQTVLKNTYDEWGNVIALTASPGWEDYDFGFAGGLYDRETGLTRFGARDYDPETGRWTSKETIGAKRRSRPGGILFAGGQSNLYEYCLNDPVNYIDIKGLAPGDCYKTSDLAAANALTDINWKSIKEDKEYGGWIYKNKDNSYSYTAPVRGNQHNIPTMSMLNNLPKINGKAIQPTAFYHTHGSKSIGYQDELFSGFGGDLGFAIKYTTDGIAYLATPKGVLKKFDAGNTTNNQFSNLPYPKKNEGKTKCGCK